MVREARAASTPTAPTALATVPEGAPAGGGHEGGLQQLDELRVAGPDPGGVVQAHHDRVRVQQQVGWLSPFRVPFQYR